MKRIQIKIEPRGKTETERERERPMRHYTGDKNRLGPLFIFYASPEKNWEKSINVHDDRGWSSWEDFPVQSNWTREPIAGPEWWFSWWHQRGRGRFGADWTPLLMRHSPLGSLTVWLPPLERWRWRSFEVPKRILELKCRIERNLPGGVVWKECASSQIEANWSIRLLVPIMGLSSRHQTKTAGAPSKIDIGGVNKNAKATRNEKIEEGKRHAISPYFFDDRFWRTFSYSNLHIKQKTILTKARLLVCFCKKKSPNPCIIQFYFVSILFFHQNSVCETG